MQAIFLSSARPFYRSSDVMELNVIEKEIYTPFIVNHFETRSRNISRKDVEKVYDLFKGHTYYIQKTFNESFADTPPKQKELLYAIAREGEAKQILSVDFIKRHRLASASSVQASIKKLLEKDIVADINKTYFVTDKLFAM